MSPDAAPTRRVGENAARTAAGLANSHLAPTQTRRRARSTTLACHLAHEVPANWTVRLVGRTGGSLSSPALCEHGVEHALPANDSVGGVDSVSLEMRFARQSCASETCRPRRR